MSHQVRERKPQWLQTVLHAMNDRTGHGGVAKNCVFQFDNSIWLGEGG